MSEFLRVALLGGGKMAHQHAAAIRRCGDAVLVAVVDPRVGSEELRAIFGSGVATFSDAQSMLAEVKPDVVHVVTPPDSHFSLAKLCLDAGAHVYVEKPFALTVADAEALLRLAETKGLKACAAHQVLFQDAGRRYRQHLGMIGEIMHVQSFFSFKPVRRRAGGGGLSTPVDQLIDILPHPVYLLLDALPAEGDAKAELSALDVSIDGEVRAVVRRGNALGTLVVSLNARPVESWLRVMGRNGMVEADFVLGNIVRHPGPGASAPAVVLKPFSRAWQIGWGSLKAVLKLIFRRHKSYPGLTELLEQFYGFIRGTAARPLSPAAITETVELCEQISARLYAEQQAAERAASASLRQAEAQLPPLNEHGVLLLTGGAGMLGRETARVLRAAGWRVRVPVRRQLAARAMLPGIEYPLTDLADGVPDELMDGVCSVVHLAAETAGTRADHERNTIAATRNLLEASTRSAVGRFINISSIAVLKPSRFGRQLTESSVIDLDNPSRGPYVWAKAEAERIAGVASAAGRPVVKTIRLGPLVDYEAYIAPGRLGREVARLFVAMGRPSNRIAVCSVATASKVIRRYVENFDDCPSLVNLVEVPAPTRSELVARLRRVRPDLVILWLPFWILKTLSFIVRITLKLLRPRHAALDLYAAFKSERYDPHGASKVLSGI